MIRTDIGRLCIQAEELCRGISQRDLGEMPLYIVPQSRLPKRLGRSAACNGYTSPFLDLHLQDVIGSDWQGRGPCMVVNDVRPRGESVAEFEYAFLGTAVHELAHILLRPTLYSDWPNATKAEIEADAARVVDHISDQKRIWDIPVPWYQHDIFFTRVALHLRYRAEQAGVLIAPTQICAGYRFSLSAGLLYDRALGDEPAQMLDATFQEIKGQAHPREFVHLWIDDTSRWKPDPEEEEQDEPDEPV